MRGQPVPERRAAKQRLRRRTRPCPVVVTVAGRRSRDRQEQDPWSTVLRELVGARASRPIATARSHPAADQPMLRHRAPLSGPRSPDVRRPHGRSTGRATLARPPRHAHSVHVEATPARWPRKTSRSSLIKSAPCSTAARRRRARGCRPQHRQTRGTPSGCPKDRTRSGTDRRTGQDVALSGARPSAGGALRHDADARSATRRSSRPVVARRRSRPRDRPRPTVPQAPPRC